MPALIELQPHEENDYNDITTKMVITWKKREEKGGWFRRARLVARQFCWSIDVLLHRQPAAPSTTESRSSMSRMLS